MSKEGKSAFDVAVAELLWLFVVVLTLLSELIVELKFVTTFEAVNATWQCSKS